MPREIPGAMKAADRWVTWRYVHKPGQSKPWTKVPYIPSQPTREASSTASATWGTFDQAITSYSMGICDGIGFMLGDGWIGFDADGCVDPTNLRVEPAALGYVELLDTYTELSPSGTGLHCLARGKKPGTRCRVGGLELYGHARYLTVTGHRVAELPATVNERTAEIATLYQALFGSPNLELAHDDQVAPAENLDDATLLERASQDPRFAGLWRGDIATFPSHSEADLALCQILGSWTGRDPARIDALFRRSGLHRPKWNRSDYRQRTIERALSLAGSAPDVGFHPLEPDMPAEPLDLDTPAECL